MNIGDFPIEKAAAVKLLLMDCDGVMTDGRLYFSAEGEAMKVFHVRDGQGIVTWHAAGFSSGIISGRDAADIIERRASELGIRFVRTRSRDKTEDALEIMGQAGVTAAETGFIGDDTGDVDVMRMVGFAVAVADAADETKEAAAFVTSADGGNAAVRETIDLILAAKQLVSGKPLS